MGGWSGRLPRIEPLFVPAQRRPTSASNPNHVHLWRSPVESHQHPRRCQDSAQTKSGEHDSSSSEINKSLLVTVPNLSCPLLGDHTHAKTRPHNQNEINNRLPVVSVPPEHTHSHMHTHVWMHVPYAGSEDDYVSDFRACFQ